MPQETLALLDRDTERLLFAGAQVARSDADLETRRQKLAPLGPRVPALAKVVEQVEKVQKARGKSAAGELLDLAVLMAQVRGAQASPAVARTEGGDLAPLPAGPPIESPLSPTELLALVKALSVRGKGRTRVLADAVKRGAARDLRLLPFYVPALGDASVGRFVEQKLLPTLGRLVAPELMASLNIEKGKATDARRLRVLAAVLDPAEIGPLLVAATAKGSPQIRVVALRLLAKVDPAQAEPIALRLYAQNRALDVRKVAVQALGGGTSDPALDVLFDAFQNKDLRSVARTALARFNHPHATERALALLPAQLDAVRKVPKGGSKKALDDAYWGQLLLISPLLHLIASRKDKPETTERVLALFRDHEVRAVRTAAARALLRSGYERAADELAGTIVEVGNDEVWRLFIGGILLDAPERAFDRLGGFLDPRSLTGKSQVAFANEILSAVHEDVMGEIFYPLSEGLDETAKRAGPHWCHQTLLGPEEEEPEEREEEEDEDEDEDEDEMAAKGRPTRLQREPRWVDAAIAALDHEALVEEAVLILQEAPSSDRVKEGLIALLARAAKGADIEEIVKALAPYRDPRVSTLLLRFLDVESRFWTRSSGFDALRNHDDPAVVPLLKAWGAGKKKLSKDDKEELAETLQFLSRDRCLP